MHSVRGGFMTKLKSKPSKILNASKLSEPDKSKRIAGDLRLEHRREDPGGMRGDDSCGRHTVI